MKMRVAFNAAFDTRAAAGIALYIRRLVPCLARLCEITVLTPDPELFAGCRVVRLPNSVRSTARRTMWTLLSLESHCRRDHDVLVSATPAVPLLGSLPSIAVVHDLTPLICHDLVPAKEKAAFWLGLQSLRGADRIVTDSAHTRSDLIQLGLIDRSRISVAYCGPGIQNAPAAGRRAPVEGPFVLYVGSFAPHKNVQRLIRAFAATRAATSLKLVLVGTGSDSQVRNITRTATSSGLGDSVVILRGLSDSDVSLLYRECHLFVCPSLYEGFGLPVLEALAHGAPVACSASSSLPEIADDAAWLFDPRSTTDMANKIEVALAAVDRPARPNAEGLAKATLFSWERTAQTIYRVAAGLVSA
jgi:glycosyltransferase involved in cell wall biosynthesis